MKILTGQKYRHYKGGEYTILNIARKENSHNEYLVIYRAEYSTPEFGMGCIWARSLDEFLGFVEVDKVSVKRFTLVSDVLSDNDT